MLASEFVRTKLIRRKKGFIPNLLPNAKLDDKTKMGSPKSTDMSYMQIQETDDEAQEK